MTLPNGRTTNLRRPPLPRRNGTLNNGTTMDARKAGTSRAATTIAALAALLALASFSADLFAQVQRVQLRKAIRYVLALPSAPALDSPLNAFFHADVDGTNIAAIPAPTVSGPFNMAGIGPMHNGGVLVYNPGDGGWRYGVNGADFGTSSRATLDSLFPNATYTFNVNGTSLPLTLAGDAYPAPPVMTLTGGTWADGAYLIDPDKPLTATTSPFVGYGSHINDVICVFVRGSGFQIPFQNVITECPGQLQRASDVRGTNFVSYTVPANTFIPGEEYSLIASYIAITNARTVDGLPGSINTARYMTTTIVKVKVALPVFTMAVTANITPTVASASAQIQFRPQDVGTQGSVFVFALAPATRVSAAQSADVLKVGLAQGGGKADEPVACVLAQLNAAGQMTAVSSANLAAYLSGVLTSQGASVSILNNVPTPNVAGATFFVGYGPDGTTMINSGVNRAALTVPGALTCEPKKPQTGWWWNPPEDGRGFSLEVRGNNMFFAAFLYDVSGRSTWYVSTGPASLEGSYYVGDLLSAAGGQTLGGPYSRFPTLTSLGSMTVSFNNESTGTLVWPGGTVPIQRFNIVQNGLNLPAVAGQPESGWWWNEQESGRGFFMEWQNGTLDIAGSMYDDLGNSVWYLTVGAIGGTGAARSFSGNWWSYGDGMTLAGPWRQHRQTSNNVAPVTITFSGSDTASMTLPNGRTTSLRRHRF